MYFIKIIISKGVYDSEAFANQVSRKAVSSFEHEDNYLVPNLLNQ